MSATSKPALGVLLFLALPPWPAVATARDVQRTLAEGGYRLHVRSVQRHLHALPSSCVRIRAKGKPFGWGRLK